MKKILKSMCGASIAAALSFSALGDVSVLSETADLITLSVSDTYILGDNDTITQAKNLVLEQLKNEAADYAGSYVESELKVSGNEIVKQQIRILTAGFMEILHVDNTRRISKAGSIELDAKAKIRVSKESVRDGLQKLKTDPERKATIRRLEQDNERLVNELVNLTNSINEGSRIDLLEARKSTLSKLNNNREATKAVFEKGTLLQLADIGSKEQDIALNDVEQNVFGYFKQKTKVSVGQPEFKRNSSNLFDVSVPVEWNLKKQPVLDVLSQYFHVSKAAKNAHVGVSVPYSLSIKKSKNNGSRAKKPYSSGLEQYIRGKVIAIKVMVGSKVGYLPISGLTGSFGTGEYAFHFSNDSNKNTMIRRNLRNPIVIKNVTQKELSEATEIEASIVALAKEDLDGWAYD